jgi:hypothetical protein
VGGALDQLYERGEIKLLQETRSKMMLRLVQH